MADGEKDGDGVWICANQACGLKYDEKKPQSWLACAICERKYDIKCQNIDAKYFKALEARKDFFWLCVSCMQNHVPNPQRGNIVFDSCLSHIKPLTDQIANIESGVEALSRKYENQTQELAKMKQKLDNVSSDLGSSVEKINTAQCKWTDIVKSHGCNKEEVTVNHVKKALEEVADKDKEMELRSRGIVIYNAVEKVSDLEEQRKLDDLKIIEDLFHQIGCSEIKMQGANRLGKFNQERTESGRHRPIKVRFETKAERDTVLASLSKLRNAPVPLKKLSIRQDLSLEQREELHEKIKEAQKRSQESSGKFFRVRGSPGQYRLVEVPKKD